MLEAVLDRYSETKLHQNHLILIGIREKIIQQLIKRKQKLKVVLTEKASIMTNKQKQSIEHSIIQTLEKQIEHFALVSNVMKILDPPKEFWCETLSKMLKECETLKNAYS